MNASNIKLLSIYSKDKESFTITVSGSSMLPILNEGDIVTVNKKSVYEVGDILVFAYKNDKVIAHRLIKIERDRYYCKGDNSFRVEDISFDQIFGAVIINDDPHKTNEFIIDSYKINKVFRQCKYDKALTMASMEYREYCHNYLSSTVLYIKNPNMEFIEIDDDNLAVYDNEGGNIHYIDNIGKTILSLLDTPNSEMEIVKNLSDLFDIPVENINGDIKDFLDKMIDLRVVVYS